MSRPRTRTLVLALVLVGVACVATTAALRRSGLHTEPHLARYSDAEPGESTRIPPAYDGAPPVIPHTIADAELSRETNDCYDCHVDDEDVPIPDSHYRNPFRGTTAKGFVTGMRTVCLQCHVPQDTTPTRIRVFAPGS